MRKYFQGLINFMEKRVLRYERLVYIGLASKRRNSYGTYVADASNRDIVKMLWSEDVCTSILGEKFAMLTKYYVLGYPLDKEQMRLFSIW